MFVKRKKCPARVDRHVGGLREREAEPGPHRDLNYFYGTFLPGFLWPVISICLVLSPYLVYLRLLPRAHTSLRQDGFTAKVSG